MRDLEVVEKLRETGGIGMVIGEIFPLFACIAFPLLLLLLELCIQPQIYYVVTRIGVDL